MKEVAKVGLFQNGKYLMGVRQDSGKWTEPGGHLEKGEDPLTGAVREVREETGLRIPKFKLQRLGDKIVAKPTGEKIKVHAYKAEFEGKKAPTPENDPDDEVFGWNWIPMKGKKLPQVIEKNLHVPGKDNVLHFFLGFEKGAAARKLIAAPSPELMHILKDLPYEFAEEWHGRYLASRKPKQVSPRSQRTGL